MTARILTGDAVEQLRTLADESVQCVVTSPPYWRQRDYGVRGQIGLESTPEEYVDNLVRVFAEVNRILRNDGTLWINIGDKWASGGNGGGGSFMAERGEAWAHTKDRKGWRGPPAGYKDKDLVGVPWMLAFALRSQGWFLRQCNIWAKPNCMPESVSDRSTASHEYVFHLSKRNDYFYDSEAARTPAAPESETRLERSIRNQGTDSMMAGIPREAPGQPPHANARLTGAPHGRHELGKNLPAAERRDKQRGHSKRHVGFNDRWDALPVAEQRANGANLRSVWWIAPAQSIEEHYAQMPATLAQLCIVAGSKTGDTILDPFNGSGTTGQVALELGRQYIGIELNPAYVELTNKRLARVTPGLALEVAC